MRSFIMMICGVIFGGLLIGCLAACSAPPAEKIQAAPSFEASEVLPEAVRDAYAGLLREVLDKQALPDGTPLDRYALSARTGGSWDKS